MTEDEEMEDYEYPACPECRLELDFRIKREKGHSVLIYVCPEHGEIDVDEVLWLMK